MQDNSTDFTADMLIRYMDGEMEATEKEATAKLLQEDAALQERYQYFLAAKRAIRSQRLQQRVQAIHQEYTQAAPPVESSAAKVTKATPLRKRWMRIAALFFLATVGYGVFQYVSTSRQSLYNDNYISYQLPVQRSSEKTGELGALYNEGNYRAVVNTFNQMAQKQQQDYFLAAQAYLRLNEANAAIDAFRQVEQLNHNSREKYFEQETDYYLALAYLKAGTIDLAEQQLNKITANRQHLFYIKASRISRTKLKMLKWKE